MELAQIFQDNNNRYKDEINHLSKLSKRLSALRLLLFLIIITSIIFGINAENLIFTLVIAIPLLLSFAFLLIRHKNISDRATISQHLFDINAEESDRLNYHLDKSINDGSSYKNAEHPFSQDLDLFGPYSLFHHINRTNLKSSRDALAQFLQTLVPHQVALSRQLALMELKEDRNWRQRYQATLRTIDPETEQNFSFSTPSTKAKNLSLALAISLGVLMILTLYASFTAQIPSNIPWVIIIINFLVLLYFNWKNKNESLYSDKLSHYLNAFKSALDLLKGRTFKSDLLKDIVAEIDQKAVVEIQKLQQLLFLLDTRSNILWPLINLILLIDLYTFWMLNRWIQRNTNSFRHWVKIINDFEVYGSLASYMELHPDLNLPELQNTTEQMVWSGQNVGHPLIPRNTRVLNSFNLNEPVNLITGSNMSGKSTFLRTIGINSLMALVGLPVCAEQLKISSFHLFTVMRTSDNLIESTSSFYAELKRIKALLQHLDSTSEPTLYFIDEILKGTNSEDRHSGAIGIIRKLRLKESKGFISTHDLQLAEEYHSDSMVTNFSFNSQLQQNKLVFDYLIQKGKCHSSNATVLMKQMKIID